MLSIILPIKVQNYQKHFYINFTNCLIKCLKIMLINLYYYTVSTNLKYVLSTLYKKNYQRNFFLRNEYKYYLLSVRVNKIKCFFYNTF